MSLVLAALLTTLLATSRVDVDAHQSVESSSEIDSSIKVEGRVEDGKADVDVAITSVPSPQVTIIEGNGHAKVNIEARDTGLTRSIGKIFTRLIKFFLTLLSIG